MDKSNIIDIDLLHFFLLVEVEVYTFVLVLALRTLAVTFAVSFLITLHELNAACRCVLAFVDVQVLRNLALGLELPDFVGKVFQDNVALLVLELSEAAHDEVTHADPDLLFHFSTDMTDAFDFVEATDEDSTVTQHLDGESILEAFVVFFGEQFSLSGTRMFSPLVVLATPPFVFRHCKRN